MNNSSDGHIAIFFLWKTRRMGIKAFKSQKGCKCFLDLLKQCLIVYLRHTQEKKRNPAIIPSCVKQALCFSAKATDIAGNALERSPASILELKTEIIRTDFTQSSEKAAGESHRLKHTMYSIVDRVERGCDSKLSARKLCSETH
ncbi:hypothetical protein Q8A67_022333 [Cirrhinus molitorella]|uniref:Uncharacterized protein n=1 Tax=Cirrhinus molitorella TaxID=172907 RepID=A0AA88P1K2_9TELE|nr:hypothetical protein Q8A67_022333 [Cirrhinus molitorella]